MRALQACSALFAALLAVAAFGVPASAFPEISIGDAAAPPVDPGADIASWASAQTVQITWEVQHAKPISEPTTVHIA